MKPDSWIRNFILCLLVVNSWLFFGATWSEFFPKPMPHFGQVPASHVVVYHDADGNAYYQVDEGYMNDWYMAHVRPFAHTLVGVGAINLLFLTLMVGYGRLPKRKSEVIAGGRV